VQPLAPKPPGVRPGPSPRHGLLRGGEDLRTRARRGLQLHRGLPRRDRRGNLRKSRRNRRVRTGDARWSQVSAAGVLGPASRSDRHLQQLHHQLPRQRDRDRREHAQRAGASEHVHQPRVGRVHQSTGLCWTL